MSSTISPLIKLSREYGSDPEYVLAGGGNTSCKDGDTLYVKASGTTLASLDEAGLVRMSLRALDAIWDRSYPSDTARREEEVLKDLLNAREKGETKRPSVEALLHAVLPQKYVVHLHPALVNGLTCSREGEHAACRLFGDAMLWIPLVNPGYILAAEVRKRLAGYRAKHSGEPECILLQNHGVFVGGDTVAEVRRRYDSLLGTIRSAIRRFPDLTPRTVAPSRREVIEKEMRAVNTNAPQGIVSLTNAELAGFLSDEEHAAPISSAFTPDHIVYSGFRPLWVPETVFDGSVSFRDLYAAYAAESGTAPKSVLVQHTGVFTYGETALALLLDTVKVAVYAESFGGALFMSAEQVDFIRTWEVEQYRAAVGTGTVAE